MTEARLKAMFAYMRATWPNKMESWPVEVPGVWGKELAPYTDTLVGLAVRDLVRSESRNQEFPFSLAELLTQIEKTRRYYDARAVRL